MGEAVGELAAPIYGMFAVEELLKGYTTPDGVVLSGEMWGPPKDTGKSAFEWTGEWTVTYETFRDMGAAFAVALILIYILVVWEFGNFVVPAVIMAPIPLTLIGIIPGHWLLGAEFTATSMIGFIALAGIIVRNSILLVDFTISQVKQGVDVREAVIISCKTRTRPIMITAWALVMGSCVILFDPIFQGMAISLLFGVLVSTMLTLIVIPLGCISARAVFCPPGENGESCEVSTFDDKPPVEGGGLGIGDVVMGAWRLFSMVAKSLLFKLWTLAMGAIFGLIEMWQSRKAVATTAPVASAPVASPSPAPVATPAPVAPTPEAKPAEAVVEVETKVEPEAKAEPEVEAKAEPEIEAKVEPEVEAKAEPEVEAKAEPEVEAKVEPEVEAKAEPEVKAKAEPEVKAEAEKSEPVAKVAPKKPVASKKVSTAKKSVTKSPIKKKSVTKKKIALKKTPVKKTAPAVKKSVAIKEGTGAKDSKNRRGIRLKKFDDDFDL